MQNPAAARDASIRSPKEGVDVDPGILAVIKSAARPIGVPPTVMPPASLPGRIRMRDGVRNIFGLLRHGVAYSAGFRARHGDIYQAVAFMQPVVVIWDADEIWKIVRNEGDVWSSGMGWDSVGFRGMEGEGRNIGALLTLDFDEHRVARKVVQPAFTTKAIHGYVGLARRGFDRAIPRWIERGRIDFKPEVRALLARVSNDIFTGIHDPAKVDVIDRALSDFWNGMLAFSRNPWLSPKFRRAREGLLTLERTFAELVPERRRVGGDDLFSQMCRVEDTDGLSDHAIVRLFLNIMFGAFDTTSAGIASMGYLLAKHPEWQERLREEAQAIPADELDVSSMKNLKQMELAWKETLRLMPVAGFVPRRALREVDVMGHRLRPGTLVMPMMGAIGRHPRWWKDPTKFDPERFSPERAEDKQHPALHLPFGAGPHACIGMQLANVEMKLFFHRLLTSCRFSLAKDYDARHTHTPMGCVSGKVTLDLEARPSA